MEISFRRTLSSAWNAERRFKDADELAEAAEEKATAEAKRSAQNKKKLVMIICAVSLVAIGAVIAFVVLFLAPESKYNKGKAALTAGNYGEAAEIFSTIRNYKNSNEQLQEVRYEEALNYFNNGDYATSVAKFIVCEDYKDSKEYITKARKEMYYIDATNLLAQGRYDSAYRAFAELGDYKDSDAKEKEAKYQIACTNLRNKEFKKAQSEFEELGNYLDSVDKLKETVSSWVQSYIDGVDKTSINFLGDLKISDEQQETVYSKVIEALGQGKSLDRVLSVLEKLPTNYKDNKDLINAIMLCRYQDTKDTNNMKKYWDSYEFTHKYFSDDAHIWYFLYGNWSNAESYYLNFNNSSNGGIQSNYNLPCVAKPAGTKYVDIRNLIYIYTDADSKELAKVFRITIVSSEEIRVFCYKDNKTYTLYRS